MVSSHWRSTWPVRCLEALHGTSAPFTWGITEPSASNSFKPYVSGSNPNRTLSWDRSVIGFAVPAFRVPAM